MTAFRENSTRKYFLLYGRTVVVEMTVMQTNANLHATAWSQIV